MTFFCALLALAGCERTVQEPTANDANQAAPAPPQPPALPRPEAALDRERLLLAVVRARSALAGGADDRAAQAELDGARFELRIRFGCGEPPAESALANPAIRHDAEARTVELRAAHDIGASDPLVAAMTPQGVEAVEGFWIGRPWLLQPVCPAGQATPASLGPVRVGIAQFYTPDDSRVGRRDERSYSTVVRLDEGQDPARPQGYDLILTGRLRAGPEGRVVRCVSPDPNAVPACLIGAEFERVRIVDAENGNELAQWSRG